VEQHAQAGERLALGGTAAASTRGGATAYAAMLRMLDGATGEEDRT